MKPEEILKFIKEVHHHEVATAEQCEIIFTSTFKREGN